MAPKRRREKEDPNNTWNMQFMAACKVGNTHEMEVLIEKGAEIDHFVKEGEGEEEIINTPLINRVRARDLPMIQWLASKGADVNKEMEQSMTPLHYAVAHDMPDVIETLMGLSPDTTKKNAAGHTAVHLAFFRRKVELAQLLLKLGAFHDFRDRQTGPYTMTQQSCVSGDMLLLETLLDLGESVHQRDMEGNTLLHLAVHHEHTALAEELLARRANVNAANAEGCTPLWRCVAKEQPEAIQFLCQRGADVNARNALGMPLLQYGIFNASKDVVVLLLQLNARVADVDSMGNSPLHWAASGQKINILEVLLDPPRLGDHKAHPEMHVGPDVNPQNIEGATPLHKACYWGRTEFINLLLNREADPTLKNALGRTPLHECAQNGHVDAATALITFNPNLMQSTPVDTKKKPAKKGKKDDSAEIEVRAKTAEVDAEDNEGQTALQVAMAYDQEAMVDMLIAHGASVHRPSAEHGTILFEAVGQGKQAIVMSLIKGGAGVNSVDPHGRMPLHVAVDRGHLAIAMALVLNGADVNAPDADQRTALHLACANGATSIARFLIVDARAAVNLWDLQGCTPLHKCAESGAVDIARLLASNEAEINALEVHTRTPLHVACEHMRPGVVQVLLEYDAAIEARDEHGLSALHMAVFSGCTDCTTHLIDAGALLNEPDAQHRTPLVIASQSGKVDCGRILVQRFKEQKQRGPVSKRPPGTPLTAQTSEAEGTVEGETPRAQNSEEEGPAEVSVELQGPSTAPSAAGSRAGSKRCSDASGVSSRAPSHVSMAPSAVESV